MRFRLERQVNTDVLHTHRCKGGVGVEECGFWGLKGMCVSRACCWAGLGRTIVDDMARDGPERTPAVPAVIPATTAVTAAIPAATTAAGTAVGGDASDPRPLETSQGVQPAGTSQHDGNALVISHHSNLQLLPC